LISLMFDEEYKLWSSSLRSFLQSPVTSSLFGPNIHLSILFSNTLSLCSSLNVRDQVSHPYRTAGEIRSYPHIWRPSPAFATWGRAMPWWRGTHLTRANGI
jgi:hypothetical protein